MIRRIRRTAATSLAEALHLAPNLQVARIDANQYAITARGFNNAIGNKLLVVIDLVVSYSVTAFHDQYQKLRAGHAAPTTIDNLAWGGVCGVEAWGNVDLARNWRVSLGWTVLRESLHAAPDAGTGPVANLGDDTRQQWSIRSTAHVAPTIAFDVTLRHVAALPAPAVPAYTAAADLRLAWNCRPGLDVSVLAQDLGRRHVEFDPSSSSRFGPTAFLKLEWATR